MTESTLVQPSVFLTAEWRYLIMLNFETDPALLRPYVPAGTELDTWNGKSLISLVGFRFQDTRVMGWAVPFHTDFEEVNLRIYVRHKGPEGWRRGVSFIKEIVPRRAIAAVARVFYNERYIALPMRHHIEYSADEPMRDTRVEYAWRFAGAWQHLRAGTLGDLQEIEEGSEAEFVTEHYWGYSAQRNGGCVEYSVEHPRWLVWEVGYRSFDCDVAPLYGDAFVDTLSSTPSSAFMAYGSPVTVHRGQRL